MPILQIQHKTRGFDAWKQSFDSDPVGREQGGVRSYRILRGTDDPNNVVIELEFGSTGERSSARRSVSCGAESAATSASRARRRGSWTRSRPASTSPRASVS
ncbi:MAG TPA: hypothetical protein VK488_07855 [Gaiellaceae bacterium]|nr:hypothetical protein [Gaiellaceae bacterium]